MAVNVTFIDLKSSFTYNFPTSQNISSPYFANTTLHVCQSELQEFAGTIKNQHKDLFCTP